MEIPTSRSPPPYNSWYYHKIYNRERPYGSPSHCTSGRRNRLTTLPPPNDEEDPNEQTPCANVTYRPEISSWASGCSIPTEGSGDHEAETSEYTCEVGRGGTVEGYYYGSSKISEDDSKHIDNGTYESLDELFHGALVLKQARPAAERP